MDNQRPSLFDQGSDDENNGRNNKKRSFSQPGRSRRVPSKDSADQRSGDQRTPPAENNEQPPAPQRPSIWELAGEPDPSRPQNEGPVYRKESGGAPYQDDEQRGRQSAAPRRFNAPPPEQLTIWELAEIDEHDGTDYVYYDESDKPSIWELANEEELKERRRQERLEREKARPSKKRRKKEKKPRPTGKRLVLHIASLAAGLMVTVGALLGVVLVLFLNTATKNDDLWLDVDQIPYKDNSLLLYKDQQTGETLQYVSLPNTQNKEYVDSSHIPEHLRQAFIAIEDRHFYKHSGFDVKRTLYAAFNEVKFMLTGSYIGGEEGSKQGGSTINQQLIKNLTRDDEVSDMAGFLRKVKEIYRAWKMDRAYDKEVIIDAYLNTISFTGNTAGAQAESRKLFNKTVDQLTLEECASLAAITKNPSRYNPETNPNNHIERRNYVLLKMYEEEFISEAEYNNAVNQPLVLDYTPEPKLDTTVTDYFTDAVIDEALQFFVDERGLTREEATLLLYTGGVRIHTTVVPELQYNMENVMVSSYLFPRPATTVKGTMTNEAGQPLLDENGNEVQGNIQELPEAAMISLGYDGGLCAVVGGLGEKQISRGFNRGTSAVRQVGSTMKTISPYVSAFEQNTITWSTPFIDSPVRQVKDENTGEMVDWPANATKTYTNSDILVREGFARSVNTTAVRVGETVGNTSMYRFVKNDLEISTIVLKDAKAGPLVLGSSTYGITPLEMARSYAIFGNGGQLPTVHSFTHVSNGTGGTLMEQELPLKKVIGEDSAFIMNRLMREVLHGDGTASGMSVPGTMDSVGKTGTTSDNRDHWFIGLTPYYVTACWYGYDSNVPLQANYYRHPPTMAWRAVMSQSQQGLAYKDFPATGLVRQDAYCLTSGYAAGANCPTGTGWYKLDYPPTQGCPLHSA